MKIADGLYENINDPKNYINANYIKVRKNWIKKKNPFDGIEVDFIASQGPTIPSFSNFWRMIISHNVKNIVMVTNIEDNGRIKCNVYFPDPVHSQEVLEIDEFITVKVVSIDKSNRFFEVRRFEVEDKRTNTKRIVNHFWVNFTK